MCVRRYITYWLVFAATSIGPAAGSDVFVAPGGNDAWSGRVARREGQSSDGPLAVLAAAVEKQTWRCEWRVPLAMLRFSPTSGSALPCNVTVYRSENDQFIQLAGSRGETWDLKLGGRLIFSPAPKKP